MLPKGDPSAPERRLMDAEAAPNGPAFLGGGAEMGALTRAFDWTTTPLGPPGSWPQTFGRRSACC